MWEPWPSGDTLRYWEVELQWKKRAVAATALCLHGIQVHTLRFSDGNIWDVINGFRNLKVDLG